MGRQSRKFGKPAHAMQPGPRVAQYEAASPATSAVQLANTAACANALHPYPGFKVRYSIPRLTSPLDRQKLNNASLHSSRDCLAADLAWPVGARTNGEVRHAAIRWVQAALVQHIARPRVRVHVAGHHQVHLRPQSRCA